MGRIYRIGNNFNHRFKKKVNSNPGFLTFSVRKKSSEILGRRVIIHNACGVTFGRLG
jgi:type IV secretory pathway VirB9-like protein